MRSRAQRLGVLALILFVILLIVHGRYHQVRSFFTSLAGLAVAILGIARIPESAFDPWVVKTNPKLALRGPSDLY